jgi:S-adenosylmethionine synthetase
MRPKAIIEQLDLLKPVYKKTAAYGHFGRDEFTWEKTDRAAKLADDLAKPSAVTANGTGNGVAPKSKRGKKDARAET